MIFKGEVTIVDEATPFLEFMFKNKKDWQRKIMKSTGWWIQKEIKAGIRSSAPAGKAYSKFMPPGIRSKLERAFGGRGKRAYPPLGKLVNAVGYQYKPVENAVVIGWLSNSAVKLGDKIEAGLSKTVTSKMPQYFWSAGVPLSPQKSTITIPARKTYDPMRAMLEPKVSGYMQNKLMEYMTSGEAKSSATRRRYIVKG